jgi:hypothetical protein
MTERADFHPCENNSASGINKKNMEAKTPCFFIFSIQELALPAPNQTD